MHASTIATILKQVETNLDFAETEGEAAAPTTKAKKTTSAAGIAVSDVCNKYVEQTKFFEDAIVREQVF